MSMIEKKMTTKEVVESLGCAVNTVRENAKKCLPNKVFENGKPTEWSEAEVTVLLDYMKEHSNVGAGVQLSNDLTAVSTSMTPALKLKKAMELAEEAYQEELARLKAEKDAAIAEEV